MEPTSHALFPIWFSNLPKLLQSYLFVSQPFPLPICVQFSTSITMLRLQQQELEFLDFLGHWSCFCYHGAHYVLLIPYLMALVLFPKRRTSPFPLTSYLFFFYFTHVHDYYYQLTLRSYGRNSRNFDNKSVHVPSRLIILLNLVTWNRNPLLANCVNR